MNYKVKTKRLYRYLVCGLNFIHPIICILYDKLGFRYMWEKFHPPIPSKISDKRPPSTFIIGLISIYLGLYTVVSMRYELSVNRLENRVHFFMSQIDAENWKAIIQEAPRLQNTKLPYLPSISSPFSSILSLLPSYDEFDLQTIKTLQAVIYRKRNDLSEVDLANLILITGDTAVTRKFTRGKIYKYYKDEQPHFGRSKFMRSNLSNASLENNVFSSADFKNATLINSKMRGGEFLSADFEGANLSHADLRSSDLSRSIMKHAHLEETNLENACLCGVDLTEAYSLDRANLRGAVYNSGKLDFNSIPAVNEVKAFLLDKNCDDSSAERLHSAYVSGAAGPADIPTQFPAGFVPAHHGMIDLYEMNKSIIAERDKEK